MATGQDGGPVATPCDNCPVAPLARQEAITPRVSVDGGSVEIVTGIVRVRAKYEVSG